MKTYSVKIKTVSGETLIYAIAADAKSACANIVMPDVPFGLTVIAL